MCCCSILCMCCCCLVAPTAHPNTPSPAHVWRYKQEAVPHAFIFSDQSPARIAVKRDSRHDSAGSKTKPASTCASAIMIYRRKLGWRRLAVHQKIGFAAFAAKMRASESLPGARRGRAQRWAGASARALPLRCSSGRAAPPHAPHRPADNHIFKVVQTRASACPCTLHVEQLDQQVQLRHTSYSLTLTSHSECTLIKQTATTTMIRMLEDKLPATEGLRHAARVYLPYPTLAYPTLAHHQLRHRNAHFYPSPLVSVHCVKEAAMLQ